ncbi:hypothetical protein CR513_21103, partial [Mucuna pruriens]
MQEIFCIVFEWWIMHVSHAPYSNNFSLKCEHNGNTFKHIHLKKKIRLKHQKLQDLVYMNDIDYKNLWLLEEISGDDKYVKII